MRRIAFIGGGAMGAAIISRACREYAVSVCDKDPARRRMLRRTYKVGAGALGDVVEQADIVVLAVKPQDSETVLEELRPLWTGKKLLISIAAGLTTRFLEKRLPPKARVVRTMPNLPAVAGQGITAVCAGRSATKADLAAARKIFSCVGQTVVVAEKDMDAVTAVSGSGPAYVFLFAECMEDAARSLGLSPALARQLVSATLTGSSRLAAQSSDDPSVLRARVTSRGGTTQAAMDVFTAAKIEQIYKRALGAAARRSRELRR